MRRLLAIVCVASAPAAFSADYIDTGYFESAYVETGYFEADGGGTTSVPDVIGEADFAAADAVLEGVGLDGGTETPTCSAAPASEIVGQSPAAGAIVALGTLVDLLSSNGVECSPSGGNTLSISIGISI